MYTSPATPTGTGRNPASSTYTRVFAIGPPIGGTPPADSGALNVAHTVTSVGPYPFTNRNRPAQRSTSRGEHASPATINVIPAGRSCSGATVASTAGGTTA